MIPAGDLGLTQPGSAFWRMASYMKGGWQAVDNAGTMEVTGDEDDAIAVHESTSLFQTLGNLFDTTSRS
ncbi:MAG: hypothetical protein MI861_02965 [Pirellulales bacterium]|nr:hypothetical protein [Pirellulales bacterium]